jgi:hypothetical protein
MPFKVRCQCGYRLTAPDSAAGRTVRCPNCGLTFSLPRAPAAVGAEPNDVGPPLAPLPKEERTAAGGACPFCQTPYPRGARLCTQCGLNFATGERMVTEEVKPVRAGPKRSIFFVALQVLYRPFSTVEELGGYLHRPTFVLAAWLFVVGLLVLDAASRTGVALAEQKVALARATQPAPGEAELAQIDELMRETSRAVEAIGGATRPTAETGIDLTEKQRRALRGSSGAPQPAKRKPPPKPLTAGVLFPSWLATISLLLVLDAMVFWAAGLIFGLRGSLVQLLLYLGFVGGMSRLGSPALWAASSTNVGLESMLYLTIALGVWQLVLYIAVLSRYYDMSLFPTIGIGLVALILKLWVAAGAVSWVQGLLTGG